MTGKHLNCTFSFAMGLFLSLFETLRHLLFVLLSYLLHGFQVTVGLKETQNKTRRQGGMLEGMPVKA